MIVEIFLSLGILICASLATVVIYETRRRYITTIQLINTSK